MRATVTVGVVGGGRAAPLAAIFAQLPEVEVHWLCDRLSGTRRSFSDTVLGARCTSELDDLLDDDRLDAVVVDEPTSIQHAIASRALAAEKHVFVADMLAPTHDLADELASIAERRELALMVGSRGLLFDPAVRKLRELIEVSRLGSLRYLEATRRIAAHDVVFDDQLWRLAAAEIALLAYLMGEAPLEVDARGDRLGGADIGLLACHGRFSDERVALVRLSQLDAVATHELWTVGSTASVSVEEVDGELLLKLYDVDQGMPSGSRPPSFELGARRRKGGSPRVLECEHFATAVLSGGSIPTGLRDAVAVSAAIDALRESLEDGGETKYLQTAPQPSPVLRLLPTGARASLPPVGAVTGPDPT